MIFSCNGDGFKDEGNNIQQKIVRLATGEKSIAESAHFAAAITFGKANQPALHSFQLYHHNLSAQSANEKSDDTLQADFKRLLAAMKEGEERIFRLPFSYFDNGFLSANAGSSIAAEDEIMQISIHILKTFEPNALAAHLMSMAQHQEISENDAIEWLLINDTANDYKIQGQIYIQSIREGNSSVIASGDALQLTYTTSFLDGRIIDRPTQIEYIPGQRGQVVRGLAMALEKSHCGDSLRVYIPSTLAFGEEGSSTGIIPPKTPLIISVAVECPQ